MRTGADVGPARIAALKVLADVRQGAFADQAFERVAGRLAEADRRLAQELAYGALRLRGRLDHLIDQMVDGGVAALEPAVLDNLRLGAYQLLELARVPAYAAVSEAVEATRRSGHERATGLVNAVLRRLDRLEDVERLFPARGEDAADHHATWGSHPRWLVERWLTRWPESDVAGLVAYDNTRPSVFLSVAGTADDALGRLAERGIAAEKVELVPGSLRIDAARIADALASVTAVVQDPAAASVVHYAGFERSAPVADLCAAPGGKAALLALGGHDVLAFDVSRRRLARLWETRERLGLERLRLGLGDATRPPFEGPSAVLLDVPCTGTGTLARHADARWRLTPELLNELAGLQARMLDGAAKCLAPGGLLVYATCSLEPEENEAQVESFLRRHREFTLERASPGAVAEGLVGATGELRVTPQRHGLDGAYAVRLRRAE